MPLGQQDYNKYMSPAAKAGQIANYQGWNCDTYPVETTVAFGSPVQLHSDFNRIVPTTDAVIGIAVATKEHDYVNKADDQNYVKGDAATIMKRGRIFVKVGKDVNNGAAVKFDTVTGTFDAESALEVPTGVFKQSAKANTLAEIEINIP